MARASALRQTQLQPLPPMQQDPIVLNGGLDEITPPFELKPGMCRMMQNFEQSIFGGYRRAKGYERADGRFKPSNAEYAVMQVAISGAVALGSTLTGNTSGATGVIIAATSTYVVLTKLSIIEFVSGEILKIAGTPVAVSSSEAIIDGALTTLLAAQYKYAASNVYRADIQKVPGEGKVLGVWLYNDVWYAFRNAVGGATAAMFKQTVAGWAQIAFEYELRFTLANGATTIIDGGTLIQGGVSATIRRVALSSGSLTAGSGAGTMVISVPIGGHFAAGAATVGLGTLTLAAIEQAITLGPSGRYEFVNHNFSGNSLTKRMYGCDGVNPAFEFDGTSFVPIHTGFANDAPHFIAAHQEQLFLSFDSSVQNSAPGFPFAWSVVLGAAEIAIGDDVTGFSEEPGFATGGALAIFCKTRSKVLYGKTVADFDLVDYRENIGAVAHTAQTMAQALFLSDRGVTNLTTTLRYGNFQTAVLTNAIYKTLASRRAGAIASCLSLDLSQYRLFFTSGYAYFLTLIGEKLVGIGQMLFPNAVRCVCSGRKNDASEEIMFGSDDGFVYQMERGTSFDGAKIEGYFNLAYNFQKSPRIKKHYRRVAFEVTASAYTEFDIGYSLGYGSTDINQPDDQPREMDFRPVHWDAFTWDAFFWDGTDLLPKTADMGGSAENVSLMIRTNCEYCENFTMTAAIIHWSMRRQLRN